MAQGILSPVARFQFFDDAGAPLEDGFLYTYEAGTSTPALTYADVDLGTENENPIPLDSAGRPANAIGVEVPIFLRRGDSYKYILKDSAGVTIWSQDNISAESANGAVDVAVTLGETVTSGLGVYMSDGSGSKVAGRWYKWTNVNPYSSTLPQVGILQENGGSGDVVLVRVEGLAENVSGLSGGTRYYASTAGLLTSTAPGFARQIGQAQSATSILLGCNPPVPTVDVGLCEGRLTLTTAVPVTTTDVTAATTFYFTPYRGSRIALYDGSAWSLRTFSEISLAVPATTITLYDVYVYDNAGTLTLELTAWTNDTTRATALVMQDGVYVKTGATTRRWLGCIRTTAVSGQTEDSKAKRYVYNFYNQVARQLRVVESTNSWPYDTATYRQMNNAGANQIDVVVGQLGSLLLATVTGYYADGGANINLAVSIGESSATTPLTGVTGQSSASTAGGVGSGSPLMVSASLVHYPAVGRYFYAALERGGGGTTTWYGDNNDSTRWQAGISGSIWM